VFDGGDPPKAPREIVWADQVGVTCRRWNWRQGVRTRLGLSTTSAYFLFDALPSFPDASLAGAMEDLSARVAALCPEAALSSFVVREPTPAG
jgi:DNA/RNA-binding domain of Phe-tRNA-synthetase-like protein